MCRAVTRKSSFCVLSSTVPAAVVVSGSVGQRRDTIVTSTEPDSPEKSGTYRLTIICVSPSPMSNSEDSTCAVKAAPLSVAPYSWIFSVPSA